MYSYKRMILGAGKATMKVNLILMTSQVDDKDLHGNSRLRQPCIRKWYEHCLRIEVHILNIFIGDQVESKSTSKLEEFPRISIQ